MLLFKWKWCFASSTAVIYSRHQDRLFSHKYTDMLKDSQTQSQEAALTPQLTLQVTLFWVTQKCQIRAQIEHLLFFFYLWSVEMETIRMSRLLCAQIMFLPRGSRGDDPLWIKTFCLLAATLTFSTISTFTRSTVITECRLLDEQYNQHHLYFLS